MLSYTRSGPPKSITVMGHRQWGIGDGAMMFGNDVQQCSVMMFGNEPGRSFAV
jgi:hypothetical protein